MTQTIARFAIATLAVLAFVAVAMLAQNIGTQLGGGVQEWLIR